MGTDGSSGITQGLAGVEFTIKLYSDVQKNGWDQARAYDVLVTDSTGRDTSIDLPYGIYQIKETKHQKTIILLVIFLLPLMKIRKLNIEWSTMHHFRHG